MGVIPAPVEVLAGMSGWSAVPDVRDHALPTRRTEDDMTARIGRRRDPFWDDGQGARRRNLVQRMEARVALILAIGACGLTAAMWLRQILPVFGIQV
jgi:hypothetical protein